MTKRICSIEACGKKHDAHGLCSGHNHKLQRYGDPLAPSRYMRRPDGMSWTDYFWFRVEVGGPDDCWEWRAGRYATGYGTVYLEDGTVTTTHTTAYELARGAIPEGLVVRHYTCGNPPCCNPSHLRTGTQKENMEDMLRHGRGLNGERNPSAILTDETVRGIRARYAAGERVPSISRDLGVNPETLRDAIKGRTWKHVK